MMMVNDDDDDDGGGDGDDDDDAGEDSDVGDAGGGGDDDDADGGGGGDDDDDDAVGDAGGGGDDDADASEICLTQCFLVGMCFNSACVPFSARKRPFRVGLSSRPAIGSILVDNNDRLVELCRKLLTRAMEGKLKKL